MKKQMKKKDMIGKSMMKMKKAMTTEDMIKRMKKVK